ncbi:MAG TPA: benzoate-CoA ligase family protein [Desulfomonilaceae bacterium]|nr:benzoate-CoA ligase family protein [Desulfomonilaceae bacterium]
MVAIGTSKMNLAHELIGNSTPDEEKTAFFCGDVTVSYKELRESVHKFANVLRKSGVKPTERVMILLPDSPMFIYAFLGSILCGAWPVPINTMLGEDDYRYLLNDSEARVLVTTEDSKAAGITTEHVCERIFPDKRFDADMAAASAEADPHMVNPEDIAFWLYSSGSTGRPKPTPHKHVSMLVTADSYAKNVLKVSRQDVCFSVSKLFFAYGLGNSLTFPLRFGASAVLLSDPPSPEKVIDTLVRFRPNIFFGVPTMYNSLLKKMNGEQFPGLRLCASAGEALPPEIYKQWKERTGLEIIDGIGSTEALHIFISNRPGEVKEGASGSLVPGYEAKIVDDEGRDITSGETGHLLIRGESITPGYWNRPEQNELRMLEDGWFRTGDMYSCENGCFVYQGRGDDMLKVGGIWVSPMEIEYVLIEHAAVSECAVVGHEVEGLIKPFAYVVLNQGAKESDPELLTKELVDFVAKRLPRFKRPWDIHFVDDLPKTATGKIQRFKLRQSR